MTVVLRALTILLISSVAVLAQGNNSVRGVLVVDPERIFQESLIGKSIQIQIERFRQQLLEENKKLERELTQEEADLAAKRPFLSAADFQILADAFNEKVEKIRATQDGKQQELAQQIEVERQKFFTAILPILGTVVEEHGGAIVFERRQVFLVAEDFDITDEVIARINQSSVSNNSENPVQDELDGNDLAEPEE